MRSITLEEHFVTENFLRATGAFGKDAPSGLQEARARLLDLGDGRLRAMVEAEIDIQVLSLAALGLDELSGADEPAVLRDVHDEAAAAVRAHPQRYRAFATPALKQPREAVKEIERCVQDLGFVGVMVDGTTDGRFLDAPEFFPVLERIADLGVPLYLHPAPPPRQVAEVYFAGLPGDTGHLLSIAGWGWHAETGLHILRLIVSGVLDRLPHLRVVVGHMGEGAPYALARSSAVLSGAAQLKRSVADTFKEQIWITTSGYFTRPPFECARAVVGFDHLMFSVDYPFSPNTRGVEFLRALALGEEDEAGLRWRHAAALLGLKA